MFFPSIYIFIVQLANEVAEVVVYNFSSSSQLNCQDNVGRQREQQVTSLCCRGESTEGSKRSSANPIWTDLSKTLSIMYLTMELIYVVLELCEDFVNSVLLRLSILQST